MIRRNANHSESQQLSEVALRVQPATFYYVVESNGEQIGAASSSLDTTTSTLVSEEYFVGEYAAAVKPGAPRPSEPTTQRTSVRWQTRLTRGFRLADLSIDISRQSQPFSINAAVEEDTSLYVAGVRRRGGHPPARYTFAPPLFTPSLAPVAFMSLLAGSTIGGGTTVNWQSCFRTPDDVRQEWAQRSGCDFFAADSFGECLDAVWRRVGASTDESEVNENNSAICRGAQSLGYRWNAIARNALGCDLSQCGNCMKL